MLIEKLILKNFLSHKHTELDFSDTYLSVLVGNNGAGKSSVMDAINYALFGLSRNGVGVREIDQLIHYSEPWMEVQLSWETDNRKYSVIRYRERGKSTKLELYIDEELKEGRIQEIQESIYRCVGTSSEIWSKTVHASQDRNSLLLASPTDRKKILFDLLQLHKYKDYEEQTKSYRKEIESKLSVFQRQFEQLNSTISGVLIDEEKNRLVQVVEKIKLLKESKNNSDLKAQELLSTFIEVKSKIDQFETKQSELLQLEQNRSQIKSKIARLTAEIEKAIELHAEIDQLKAQADKVKSVEQQTKLEQTKFQSAEQKHHNHRIQLSALQQQYQSELKQLTIKLTKINGEIEANCSQCGQQVTEDHRSQHSNELQSQIDEKSELLEKTKQELETVNKKYSDVCEYLNKLLNRLKQCDIKTNQIRSDIAISESKTEQIEEQNQELVSYSNQLTLIEDKIEKLKIEINQYNQNLADFKSIQQQRQLLIQSIEQTNSNIETGITLKTKIENKIKDYELNIVNFNNLQQEIKQLETQELLASELIKAFSQSGIPFKIIEQTLPVIEDNVNEKLQELNANLKLKFQTSKQLKTSGKVADTLDILIENNLGELVSAEMCSGGERLRLDLSLRVALSEYLALYNNISSLKTVFLDEYFSALDEDGQQRVMNVLDEMGTKLGIKVIFITHLKEVQEYGTSLFFFEKVEGVSKVFKKHE